MKRRKFGKRFSRRRTFKTKKRGRKLYVKVSRGGIRL